MKIKTIAQTILAASIAVATGAQAYQVELNGNYSQYSADGSDTDRDVLGLGAKYYIDPVRVGSNPLEEAAFLAKANNIEIGFGKTSLDGSEEDTDVIGLGGEMYLKQSPLYLAAKIAQIDDGTDEDEAYSAKIGYLPSPALRLTAGIIGNSDDTDPTLGAKYVTSTGSNTINLEADILLADETGFSLAGDLYVDPTLSFGLSYADQYADLDNMAAAAAGIAEAESVIGINAKKYFTPQFAIGVNYAQGEVGDTDIDGFGINLTGRF